MGGKSLSTFVQHSLYAPAFQPFMGASRVELGMCTYTPAQAPFRGPLASFPVKVYGAPVLALQHMSGMIRSGVAQTPPVIDMVIRLEQQRRPPNQGCWMIYEVLDVRYAFAGDMGNTHVGAWNCTRAGIFLALGPSIRLLWRINRLVRSHSPSKLIRRR